MTGIEVTLGSLLAEEVVIYKKEKKINFPR